MAKKQVSNSTLSYILIPFHIQFFFFFAGTVVGKYFSAFSVKRKTISFSLPVPPPPSIGSSPISWTCRGLPHLKKHCNQQARLKANTMCSISLQHCSP